MYLIASSLGLVKEKNPDGQQRLAKNVPITLDNSRKYDSTSYLTANPAIRRAAAEKAAKEARAANGELSEEEGDDDEDEDEDEDEDMDDDQEEEMPEAGPSTIKPPPGAESPTEEEAAEEVQEEEPTIPQPPPKIMITTSPSPCKLTYQFCDELTNVFPGGEFFKRPRGKGFELGRLARWGIKRGFGAVIVVNEDHKAPSTSLLPLFFPCITDPSFSSIPRKMIVLVIYI